MTSSDSGSFIFRYSMRSASAGVFTLRSVLSVVPGVEMYRLSAYMCIARRWLLTVKPEWPHFLLHLNFRTFCPVQQKIGAVENSIHQTAHDTAVCAAVIVRTTTPRGAAWLTTIPQPQSSPMPPTLWCQLST